MSIELSESKPFTQPPTIDSWALPLFDGTTSSHRLSASARVLLAWACAAYNTGTLAAAGDEAWLKRDIVLARRIPALSRKQQAMVACVVALQAETPRPRREPSFVALKPEGQRVALRLAALLQLARGLASASPDGLQFESKHHSLALALAGAEAQAAIETVEASAQLWRDQIGEVQIRVAEPNEPLTPSLALSAPGPSLALPCPASHDALTGDEPITEGARRVLRRFFERLLARERAVLRKDESEDVHQMRVACRRLRASLQIVEDVYDPKQIRLFRRGLQRVAHALAEVRDLDVLSEHVQAYQASLAEEKQAYFDALVQAIGERRASARGAMLKELQRKRFLKLKRSFARFLTTPNAGLSSGRGIDATTRVRDMAGSALWRRYEQWRAYETRLNDPNDALALHDARIAGKRLRYTIEFFADALGPNVEQLLEPLTNVQTTLGELQDVEAARLRMHSLGIDTVPGAEEYLAARAIEAQSHYEQVPQVWGKVASATYRRRLWEAISRL